MNRRRWSAMTACPYYKFQGDHSTPEKKIGDPQECCRGNLKPPHQRGEICSPADRQYYGFFQTEMLILKAFQQDPGALDGFLP